MPGRPTAIGGGFHGWMVRNTQELRRPAGTPVAESDQAAWGRADAARRSSLDGFVSRDRNTPSQVSAPIAITEA